MGFTQKTIYLSESYSWLDMLGHVIRTLWIISESFLKFDKLLTSQDARSCRTRIEYKVAMDDIYYREIFEDTIIEKSTEKQVIVFLDSKAKAKIGKIKKFCSDKTTP